jgi:hypothetical protein
MLERSRWTAIGAAVAVVLGAGIGLPSASAAVTSGNRAVFVPMEPCRLFDTRPATNVGVRSTPITANESFTSRSRDRTGTV